MLKTLDQIIFGGEISHTTPKWNLSGKAARDDCLKLYIPLAGQAQILLDREKIVFRPQHIYLFNAALLQSQKYTDRFEHFWIHFMPASLILKHSLFKNFRFFQWGRKDLPFTDELVDGMSKLVSQKAEIIKRRIKDTILRAAIHLADDAFKLKIQAYLAYLIGDVLSQQKIELTSKEESALEKLLPAVDYMDIHYLSNPPLEQIADICCIAPAYFHRLFVKHFDLSPHRYMQRKRLSDARQLLLNTNQHIKQIAKASGYENEFYFSRVFKNEYDVTPTKFRNMLFAS